jgi:hypothetical protein
MRQAEAEAEGAGGWAGKVARSGPIYGQQQVLGELREMREQQEHEEAARDERRWDTRYKSIAELMYQLNREGDFAILCTAKTKIAFEPVKGVLGLQRKV